MAGNSDIEWTQCTWNPIIGCLIVSPGCINCYAMKMANRLAKNPATPHYAGTVQPSRGGPVWTGKVALAPDNVLTAPLRRRKPTVYFVNSMGDLFADGVPDEWLDRVFDVMAQAQQHTFQILTKRAERMREYVERRADRGGFPPPNVWLGVSVEDQARADERIPHLLATPAQVRFLSVEPMLGRIDLGRATLRFLRHKSYMNAHLHWVICGGESGPGARPMHPDWARSLRDQCVAAGVPFFFKQWGAWIGVTDIGDLPGGRGPGFGRYDHCPHDHEHDAVRVGKKIAGRLLDGREWNQMPGDER